ncbi:hypothetical protein VOLCADRAFT_100567 [Volvox carteri f. nagariensis]|uniref:Uncharacterized protein n=1 Tax=Volvox carteri f. nagariensis TaxID=3068 RepID=D8UKI2_VOLCA|nr:uncharacterized protein VOLCADRAFT_100567 [Volvox carteri f. nagariensis]EFJ39756.1 hypothetical protein VOLCADRAFT_100567 [Volvox carteri f. nagariensis]|eukprot:XP_002959166.1 hypothetical protein VOLCADRAFT_100567 [Volvox carteri f. nagariensis]
MTGEVSPQVQSHPIKTPGRVHMHVITAQTVSRPRGLLVPRGDNQQPRGQRATEPEPQETTTTTTTTTTITTTTTTTIAHTFVKDPNPNALSWRVAPGEKSTMWSPHGKAQVWCSRVSYVTHHNRRKHTS